METRNGRVRPATTRTTASAIDDEAAGILTTKAVSAAYDHPTPRDATIRWRCADHEAPELFDPTDDETLTAARDFCGGCETRDLCLDLGVRRSEWGVWGGVLLEGGKPVEQPRRMGRPRKISAA